MTIGYKKAIAVAALTWVSCLAVSVIAHLFILGPQKACRQKVAEQFEQKKRLYNEALNAGKDNRHIQLRDELAGMLDVLGKYAVANSHLADLTFDISRIADERKVDAFSIKSRNSSLGNLIPGCESLSSDQMEVRFTGSFNQFAEFLNLMERHEPVVFVDTFKIERSEDGVDNKVSMTLEVLVRDDGSDVASAAIASPPWLLADGR